MNVGAGSLGQAIRGDTPSRHSDKAPGQNLGFGLGEGRDHDLGRATKDGFSQRSAGFPENGEPTTDNEFFQLPTCNIELGTALLTHPNGRKDEKSFLLLSPYSSTMLVSILFLRIRQFPIAFT